MRREFRSGALWTAVQKFGARGASLITITVLTRALTPEEFGLVALAISFISLCNVFIDFGVATYVVQVNKLTDELLNSTFWVSLASGGLLAGTLLGASLVLDDVFEAPGLTPVVAALSASLMLSGASSVQQALLKRSLNFKALAVRFLAGNLMAAAVAVTLALRGAGVWALVAQTLVASLVSTVMLWRASSWRPTGGPRRAEARAAYSYGASVVGTNVVMQAESQGVTLLIAAAAGPRALGFYVIAGRVSGLFLDLTVMVAGASANPIFARYRDQPERLRRGYLKVVELSTSMSALVLGVCAGASVVLIPLAFGEQWRPATGISVTFALMAVVSAGLYFDRPLLLALGKQKALLRVAFAETGASLLVMAILLPYGLLAAVIGRALVLTTVSALWPWLVVRNTAVTGAQVSRAHALSIVTAAVAAGGTYASVGLLGGALDSQPMLLAVACLAGTALAAPVALLRKTLRVELVVALRARAGRAST